MRGKMNLKIIAERTHQFICVCKMNEGEEVAACRDGWRSRPDIALEGREEGATDI